MNIKILRFTEQKNHKYDNTSIINIRLHNDILIEIEHKIKQRLIDVEIEQKLPVIENIPLTNDYHDTSRIRSYVKITKKDINSDIETYSIFIYHILNISHVLILTKYRTNTKSFLIYKTTDKLPDNIISDAIYTENLAHKTVIEKSQDTKIISKSNTSKIVTALNRLDPETHPVITIPLTDILDPILLEFYYVVLNGLHISRTPSDILSRLVWILMNL
jgi:hypothetical protein